MATYLPPIVWFTPTACEPAPEPAAAATTVTEPPALRVDTVGDYIDANNLDLMISNPGLRELPIGVVTVEHDAVAQLTYFVRDGTVIGSASWPLYEDGPEVYAGRGQQPVQPDRGA